MSFIPEDPKSYSKLAQIYSALSQNFTLGNIKKIITKEGNINYRIPAHSFIKSYEPALSGGTALHIALKYRNTEVVELLLHVGADYTIKNNDGFTALHYIATSDFHSISNWEKPEIEPFIDAILSAHVTSGNYINPCNNDGLSHLHIACMVNHTDAVKFFLKNGADVNQTVNANTSCNSGYTPLHFAVKCGKKETVKILLDHGANIFLRDDKGMSSLHILLEQRIYTYDSMDMESSSIELEDMKDNEDIMMLLLEKITHDKLIIDNTGLSRFHIACTSQDTSMVESLLQNFNDIDHSVFANSPMWSGYTGLHFAAHCNVNTVKLLLAREADLEVKDEHGDTPFDICLERYEIKDIHSIVLQKEEWKNIPLSNGELRLSDLLFLMENLNRLRSLSRSNLINAQIPKSSNIWPGYTPLHLAVTFSERQNMRGDYFTESELDLVKECLENGADVTIKDNRGWTPLNLAYRQNKMRIVDLLLQCHDDLIIPTDEDNLSHLHIACEVENESLVERLLLRTGDVNIIYKGSQPVNSIKPGYTPLHIAVVKKNLKIIEILMRYGADINMADFCGCTPIHEILGPPNYKIIDELLFSSPKLRECVVDGVGLSHLHIACKNNNVDVVDRLLQLGADINQIIVSDKFADDSQLRARYKGCTALHIAVMCLNVDVVIFLLSRGADILANINNGPTPLFTALDEQYRICFRYFIPILKADEDLQIRMEKLTGITMLHIACYMVDFDEVQKLLHKGKVVNAQINKDSSIWAGYTPLHILSLKELEYASNRDMLKDIFFIYKILIGGGADITLVNAEGSTPIQIYLNIDHNYLRIMQLMNYHTNFQVNPVSDKGLSHFHLACFVLNIRAVENFLQYGADVNKPVDFFSDTYPGCSPIQMAINARWYSSLASANLEIVNLLLRHGADVNAENSHGYTALHSAARAEPTVRKQILEKILTAGADINSVSIYGETPLEIMLSTKNVAAEEVRFFVEHNVRVNSHNPNNDKGYLAMLLSKKHHTIPQDAAFEEMMKASDIGKKDKKGRTAIHNIVATTESSISTEHYMKLIKRFQKLGCDIDSRDVTGWTALHLAAQFGNKEATVALLSYGADVDVIDVFQKLAFCTASLGICKKCENVSEHKHTEVIQAFALHIRKLQLLNLSVNRLNVNIKEVVCSATDVDIKFHKEVDVARKLRISDTTIVAADFLSETKAVIDYSSLNVPDRNAVDQFFESIDNHKFEQLRGVLLLQYRKAVSRLRLIEPAITALRTALQFPFPELHCREIFQFLCNKDLENLIESLSGYADISYY